MKAKLVNESVNAYIKESVLAKMTDEEYKGYPVVNYSEFLNADEIPVDGPVAVKRGDSYRWYFPGAMGTVVDREDAFEEAMAEYQERIEKGSEEEPVEDEAGMSRYEIVFSNPRTGMPNSIITKEGTSPEDALQKYMANSREYAKSTIKDAFPGYRVYDDGNRIAWEGSSENLDVYPKK